LQPSADLEKLSSRYDGDYGQALRAGFGFELQVEGVSKHLQCPLDKVLYGMRYGEMLNISVLLTAKANAEAERMGKMENEINKQK